MKESVVRKWHRRMGGALALFIILQVGTGLVLTIGDRVDVESLAAVGMAPFVYVAVNQNQVFG